MIRWIVLALLLALPASAQSPRLETLRWTQPGDVSQVAGWRAVGWGHTGNYVATFDLGKPTPDAQGIYSATISLEPTWILYVRLLAWNAGGESGWSNARLLLPPTPTFGPVPGQAPPPAVPELAP